MSSDEGDIVFASFLDPAAKRALLEGKWYKHWRSVMRYLRSLRYGRHVYVEMPKPTNQELAQAREEGGRNWWDVWLEKPVLTTVETDFIDDKRYRKATAMVTEFYAELGLHDFAESVPPAYRVAALSSVSSRTEDGTPRPRSDIIADEIEKLLREGGGD